MPKEFAVPNATVITPDQLNPVGNGNLFDFGASKKCLAQGDSWFSIGAVPFWATTNLLAQLVLKEGVFIVNCAQPGRQLSHMTEGVADTKFLQLLGGPMSYKWDVILLSGGGNDLIDVFQVQPTPDNQALRLLLTPGERDLSKPAPDRYVSEAGWTTFASHMRTVIQAFLAERDKGQNAGTPVVMHTYDYATPRDAGAGPLGPWLYPALDTTYQVPPADWQAVAKSLIDRLATLLQAIATEHRDDGLTVVHTVGTIAAARPGSTGADGDWENEIHPDPHGYVRLAQCWQPVLEDILFPAAPALALVAA